MGTSSPLKRALSPVLIRAGARLCGDTLRLDLHPADLQHPQHMLALEHVLHRAGGRREAITYDQLLAADSRAGRTASAMARRPRVPAN